MADMNELAKQCKETRSLKGFYTPPDLENIQRRNLMLGKMMLVVTEAAEAAEAVRNGDTENFEEELADIIIRVFDIAASTGIDIEKTVIRKMAFNASRSALHGKKTTL